MNADDDDPKLPAFRLRRPVLDADRHRRGQDEPARPPVARLQNPREVIVLQAHIAVKRALGAGATREELLRAVNDAADEHLAEAILES